MNEEREINSMGTRETLGIGPWSCAILDTTSENWDSTNFALTEFYEVRHLLSHNSCANAWE
jgi:hypothetical protein